MSHHRENPFGVSSWKKALGLALTLVMLATSARADLFIRDDLADNGTEANPSSGPMWLSPDIWVLNDPLPGWNPYPYPIGSPPAWAAPMPTPQDAEYRSPLSGRPNYVYVRVRNTGSASTGTERLQLYWASASTGLNWDPLKAGGSFIDNVQNNVLFGAEITKVRENAANATPTERNAYIAAITKIADTSDPAMMFPGGDSFWHTQQEIHRFGPTMRHGSGNPFVPSVAFLPWHREYINRYEGLLREANPTVKLLYWNWTDHPQSGPFDLFTNTFMGASGSGQAAGVPIGAPLSPATDGLYPNIVTNSTAVVRRLQPGAPPAQPTATVLNRSDYDSPTQANDFSGGLERFSHNGTHVFLGGSWSGGNIFGDHVVQNYAARDPSFFLLHAKVDELWARWQRKTLLNLDPATTFGTATGDANITATMGPWDGTAFGDGLPNDTSGEIEPWTLAGGQLYAKQGDDRSVTSPPFYDTSPLTIPPMQPNEEVILEIPWYPPNPASFGNVSDPNHVCLIARIETTTGSPFGMTTAETSDINFNTKQNNNIAWRNVAVVDTFPGPFMVVRFFMRNIFRERIAGGLRLGATLDQTGMRFFELGTVRADLGRELFDRWKAGGSKGRGFEVLRDGQLRLTQPDAVLEGLALKPNEAFPVRLTFELRRDYRPTRRGERIVYDVVQTGTPRDPRAVAGGQRYEVAVEKLTPVRRGRAWRLLPGTKRVDGRWSAVEFDDSKWYQRRLDLGLVNVAGECDAPGSGPVTTYFRHAFDVEDPAFFRNLLMRIKRSDGAVAYLNGKEVYRANMPDGVVTGRTLARAPVNGVERNAYFPVKLEPALLRRGRNVLAVEVHRAAAGRDAPTFDLELNANWESPQQEPHVQFANVANGTLLTVGKTVTLEVDALKTDGAIRSVAVTVDGKPLQTLERGPFRFNWRVEPGPHRFTATVTGYDGQQSRSHVTLTGVGNVPPRVTLSQPSQHTQIAPGDPLVAVARADDPDGRIVKVDFFVHDSFIFGAPARFVGTSSSAPFTLTLRDLKKGHSMISAVAHDNGGARTASIPVMVIVGDDASGTHAGQHRQ
jgi:hypothetical protein